MKRLKNNQGLTLVELIVSIAILAIIVLPLLTSFVQATKTNVKAKNKQYATEVAQNIMEGLQNVSLEEIERQFDISTPPDEFDLFKRGSATTGKLYYDDTNSRFLNPREESDRNLITQELIERNQENHKYYYYISGLEVNNSNKKYNVFVTLDAKTGVEGTKHKQYNTTEVANMQSVDTTYDAISANADTANMIISTIQLQYGITGLTQSDISRTITVDIAKDSTTGVTTVTASYKYYIRSRNITFPEAGSLHEQDYVSVIYDNSSHVDDALKNVYLFYYPWYTSTHSYPLATDSIVINNPDNVDCNVHIIKQTNTDASYLYSAETGYRCAVYVNEPANNGANTKAHTKINTNIGKNIAISDPTNLAYNISNQVTYIYNNTNANQSLVVNGIIDINAMTDMEESDRLFDVTVDVYPSNIGYGSIGSTTPLVTFTGGMSD